MLSHAPTIAIGEGDKYIAWAAELLEAVQGRDVLSRHHMASRLYGALFSRRMHQTTTPRDPHQSLQDWAQEQSRRSTALGLEVLQQVVQTINNDPPNDTELFVQAYEKENRMLELQQQQDAKAAHEESWEASRAAAAGEGAPAQADRGGDSNVARPAAQAGKTAAEKKKADWQGADAPQAEPAGGQVADLGGGWAGDDDEESTAKEGEKQSGWQAVQRWKGGGWKGKGGGRGADAANGVDTAVGKALVSLIKYGGRGGHFEGNVEPFEAFGCRRWVKIELLAAEVHYTCRQLIQVLFKVPSDGRQRLRALLDEHEGILYVGTLHRQAEPEAKTEHYIITTKTGHFQTVEEYDKFISHVKEGVPNMQLDTTKASESGQGSKTSAASGGVGKAESQAHSPKVAEWGAGWNEPVPKGATTIQEAGNKKAPKDVRHKGKYKDHKRKRRHDKTKNKKVTDKKDKKESEHKKPEKATKSPAKAAGAHSSKEKETRSTKRKAPSTSSSSSAMARSTSRSSTSDEQPH